MITLSSHPIECADMGHSVLEVKDDARGIGWALCLLCIHAGVELSMSRLTPSEWRQIEVVCAEARAIESRLRRERNELR